MQHENARKLIEFVKKSPTAFHAVDTICRELAGFTPLGEQENWHLLPGGKYYVTRNRSSVIAFTLPENAFTAFQLVASHSDSPTFKIKENAEVTVRNKYVQLNTERYGGMIMASWFDRPLSVAGRALVRTEKGVGTVLANSFMLSADNAHAVHPNHPEYADPVNCTYMNEGIVIKFNANQKYTTDGVSEAVFHLICKKAGVPVQHYANRSDMAGGSTLGNISGSHVSINTLDIGLAQLAMHSCYETAGADDVDFMITGMKAFYETEIDALTDGDYRL